MAKDLKAEDIVLDINVPDVKEAFTKGVQPDWFDYRILGGGFVFIVTLILVLIFGTAQLYMWASNSVNQEVQSNLKYVDTAKIRLVDKTRLESTGIVDEKTGVYHIPIEKAIDLVAVDGKAAQ